MDHATYVQARVELTLTGYPQFDFKPGGADALHCGCQTLLSDGFMAFVKAIKTCFGHPGSWQRDELTVVSPDRCLT